MGEMRNPYKILIRESEGKNDLGDREIHGRIILECIFKKQRDKVMD
jgi:hypothetical protein